MEALMALLLTDILKVFPMAALDFFGKKSNQELFGL